MAGVGLSGASGCLVIYGGGWYVHLLPKMVNKINAIEYSGGTGKRNSLNINHKVPRHHQLTLQFTRSYRLAE